MAISSTSNPLVKRVRALRLRKEREITGTFFVEGIRIVGAAADARADIETCLLAPELLQSSFGRDVVERLRAREVPIVDATAEVFRSFAGREGPQGLGAVVRQRWSKLEDVRPANALCWVALDRIQDPGNLGTILRTCDAVGAAGVILVGPSVDPFDPAAVRASMGAVFTQHLVRAEPGEFVRWVEAADFHVIGTSDAAEADYHTAEYADPAILFMGSEREGLSVEEKAACDLMVSIPMVGTSDSLNLAVATSLMLYELYNRRRDR